MKRHAGGLPAHFDRHPAAAGTLNRFPLECHFRPKEFAFPHAGSFPEIHSENPFPLLRRLIERITRRAS
ncbi:hypothetical protein [Burkholderia sp. lig30]|uniref:hypothetical protein n=1 Tax=Burkholderia sp. lig30 TaxID=1192124 RepID=UPI00128F9BF1|nr:hypothetical protein [Burkholderia sp. lig30]